MAQYLKDEVDRRILEAALRSFAENGFDGATMARIARAAGISTGNIYRYYRSKEELLRAAVPGAWVKRFRSLLRKRIGAAQGADAPHAVEPSHPYAEAAEELLAFAIEHRLRVVIVLDPSGGPYRRHRADVIRELQAAAMRHFGMPDRAERGSTFQRGLEEIYRNYVASLVRLLEGFEQPDQIRKAVREYERYHLAGLRAYFVG